jgi:hypothetical protein
MRRRQRIHPEYLWENVLKKGPWEDSSEQITLKSLWLK